jgi:hypothetical protein
MQEADAEAEQAGNNVAMWLLSRDVSRDSFSNQVKISGIALLTSRSKDSKCFTNLRWRRAQNKQMTECPPRPCGTRPLTSSPPDGPLTLQQDEGGQGEPAGGDALQGRPGGAGHPAPPANHPGTVLHWALWHKGGTGLSVLPQTNIYYGFFSTTVF